MSLPTIFLMPSASTSYSCPSGNSYLSDTNGFIFNIVPVDAPTVAGFGGIAITPRNTVSVIPPTVNDDYTKLFGLGSLWEVPSIATLYICTAMGSTPNNATWIAITGNPSVFIIELTPEGFGAVGDGVTDDSDALNTWFAAIVATKLPGRIVSWYGVGSPLVWDFTSVRTEGIKITGNGMANSGFVFTSGVASPNLQIKTSGDSGFYPTFRDFGVHGNVNGVVLQLGDPNNIALNEMIAEGIEVKNINTGSSAVGTGLAALYNCQLFIVSNVSGKGNAGTKAVSVNGNSSGAVAFCKIAGSFGNANTGLSVDSGFFYGNTLLAIDIEECQYSMGGASAFIGTNAISGGTLVFDIAAFNFSAWNGYQFWDGNGVNIAPNAPGALTFAAGSKITVVIHGKDYSVTPSVPASGVPFRNIFPNMILVTVYGEVDNPLTSVHISNPDEVGENIVLPVTGGSFTLTPGEQIDLTYSLLPPSWLWRAIL